MDRGSSPRFVVGLAPANLDFAPAAGRSRRMRLLTYAVCGVFVALPCAVMAGASTPAPELNNWVVEQVPGGHVDVSGNALVIDDAGGCCVWWKQKLTAPVAITYDVTVVARSGPHDRVSDVNCFWMASDPTAPGGCPFAPGHGRTGRFKEYDSLETYYVGMGGNTNSTTRFRRYDGKGDKPLEPKYDLRSKEFLLEPNHTYHIRVVARDGVAEYWRDGRKIFSFRDPAPLTRGWFALRTVQSHLEVRNFKVVEGR